MSDIQTSFVHQFIPFMVFIIIQLLKYSFNNNQLEPLSLLKFQTLHHNIEIFSHLTTIYKKKSRTIGTLVFFVFNMQ